MLDGVPYSTTTTITVTMDKARGLVAYFSALPSPPPLIASETLSTIAIIVAVVAVVAAVLLPRKLK